MKKHLLVFGILTNVDFFSLAGVPPTSINTKDFTLLQILILFYLVPMLTFNTTIQKFGKQGEKTGWTYIVVPEKISKKLNPGVKKSYRVKGKLRLGSWHTTSVRKIAPEEHLVGRILLI